MALFDDLLADQDAKRIYLVHLQPANVDVPVVVNYYLSQGTTVPSYDGHLWRPRVVSALTVSTGIDAGDDFLSNVGTEFGAIEIANGDGEMDELCQRRWDGRAVTVYMGGEDFDFSDFEAVFTGTAKDATWDPDTIQILLRDFDAKLDRNLQGASVSGRYAGTGAYEGGDDLKDAPKPLAYGICRNVPAVLVDEPYLLYQVHDGSVAGIDAVYDMMEALTDDGDTNDLYAWEAVKGRFKTDESRGMFRLGSRPQGGTVTADVRGCNSGGYESYLPALAKKILLDKGGLVAGDLDTTSFTTLGTYAPYEGGVYIDSDTAVSEVLDYLLGSCGAARYWNRSGQMVVKQIRLWSSVGTLNADDIVQIQRVETEMPVWERILGYKRNYVPMTDDEVAGDVTGAARTFALLEWRSKVRSNVLFKANYRLLAQSIRTDTAIDAEADAATEADRQLALFGAGSSPYKHRDRYNVTLVRHQFLYNPLDVVTLEYPRFGLDAGRDFIILGLSEDTVSGKTELRLWG